MTLRIQDPEAPSAPTLQESLLEACQGAIRGGGAFAFVTKEGSELLFKDDIFKTLLTGGTFDLVVGIDEITNVRALQTLQAISEEFPNLTVRVFYHELRGPMFHPKFCWFRRRSGGTLITGSGNLTARGLRGNWEAFTVTPLSTRDANAIEQQWTSWTGLHNHLLRAPDDASVLAQAAMNNRRPIRRARRRTGARRPIDLIADQFALPQQVSEVLVAEIPRASTRWNQANFDLNTFRNFFGMQVGNTQLRAVLQHVAANGELGVMESRQGVSVRSQNYRLELQAAAGLPYPTGGRPIAVFIRVATRTFRYRLLMPTDTHYAIILGFLANNWVGPGSRVRRIVTNTQELRRVWPDSPLWINT